MDKITLFAASAAVLVAGGMLFSARLKNSTSEGVARGSIVINEKKIDVEYARTMSEQQVGLMNRTQLAPDAGMLFIFRTALPRSFWNQGTLIPLDVIWIRKGVVIGVDMLPRISEKSATIFSPGLADQVLEVNYGFAEKYNIKQGSIVSDLK